MKTDFLKRRDICFAEHPKFPGVRFAKCVDRARTGSVSVSFLEIPAGTEIPIHTHEPQVDSILVLQGAGQAFVNGEWEDIETGDYLFVPAGVDHGIRCTGSTSLRLFVHHSPPLF